MICVVIKGPTFQEAHQQILKAAQYADLVELRLDCFEVLDLNALKSLRAHFSIPLIFTLRSQKQGGSYAHPEEKRLEDIRKLASLKPEYLDLENHLPKEFIEEMSKHREIKVILSYHNFEETPQDLEGLLLEMCKTPASIYKIAVTAKNSLDAMKLLRMAKGNDGKLIAISMGPHGQITRILAPVMGCPITYAALDDDQKSAPGQLTAQTLIDQYHHRSLNPQTKVYGLIGDPVGQSISDVTHNTLMASCALNAIYVKIQVHAYELEAFLKLAKQLPFHGLSVTMPLKEHIIPFLDNINSQVQNIGALQYHHFNKISEHNSLKKSRSVWSAKLLFRFSGIRLSKKVHSLFNEWQKSETGVSHSKRSATSLTNNYRNFVKLTTLEAVNTLLFENGKLSGFNTDGMGALNAIEKNHQVKGKRLVIIGAGGATKAIAFEAKRRGALVTILNRDADKALQLAQRLQCIGKGLDYMPSCAKEGYDILINCTPAPLPIDPQNVLSTAIVMDIKTKPMETELIKQALKNGCRIVYGYEMFLEQAVGQFSLWFKDRFNEENGRSKLERSILEVVSPSESFALNL